MTKTIGSRPAKSRASRSTARSTPPSARATPRPGGWSVKRGDARTPIDGGKAEIDLRVRPPGGHWQIVTIKPAELLKPPTAFDAIVNASGCTSRPGGLRRAIAKAAQQPPRQMLRTTHRSGPIDDLFVMPSRVVSLSKNAQRDVVFDRGRAKRNVALAALGHKAGTLKSWRSNVAGSVTYSSVGMTVVGAALAAPLLEKSGLSEGFLLNLAGHSTGGKSVFTLVPMSVQGEATRACMIPPTVTERALEEVGQGFNHLLFPIDDLSKITNQSDVRKACRWMTYQFSDGGGRLVGDTAMREGLSFERFRAIGLMSYERGSAEIAAYAGQARQPGEQARMFDLFIDPVEGVFDRVPDSEKRSREEIAKRLEEMVKLHHGTALPAFLRWVYARDPEEIAGRIRALISRFVEQVAAGGDNVQRRAADKFGLIYAALVLARAAGVILWRRKDVFAAVSKTYRAAMSDPLSVATAAELVDRLRIVLKKPGHTLQAAPNGKVREGLGSNWLAITGLSFKGAPTLGLREATLRSSFPNGVEYDRLIAELCALGWLTRDKGRDRWQPRLREGPTKMKPRLMRVSLQLLAG